MVFHLRRNEAYYIYLDDDGYGAIEEELDRPIIKRTTKAAKEKLNSKGCRATSLGTTTDKQPNSASLYVPKRSARVASVPIEKDGDGDTWVEIPVTMISNGSKASSSHHKTSPRSLFFSVKTKAGVWDEPPSGASNIIYREVK